MKKTNVVDIDQPRCSRCGQVKPLSELNGYNPFAPVGEKYTRAYCMKIAECDSEVARAAIEKLRAALNRS